MGEESDNRLVDEQKRIILGRVQYLLTQLRNDLADVDTFDKTVEPVKNFYTTLCEELRAYNQKVMLSNPRPCPDGQIWCIPKMMCTPPDRCNREIE
jgi:hypothetical protein